MRPFALSLGVLVGCQAGPELSTSVQELVTLSPGSHDFGTLEVGAPPTSFTFSVNPASGANDDTVTAITASCPDFSVDAPNLPYEVYRTCDTTCLAAPCVTPLAGLLCNTVAYQTYAFSASFHPTVAGGVSCVVTVQLNGATDHTITLSGTGTVPPIVTDVTPVSIAFGDVRTGTTSTGVPITVRNAGGSTMTISKIDVTAGFDVPAMTSAQVAPGASLSYPVTCSPQVAGASTGSVTVTTDDPVHPAITVPLSCNGVTSTLDVSPSPATLPATRVGEPTTAMIAIQNTGAATLLLEDLALTGANLVLTKPGLPMKIDPMGSITVMVAFDAATAGDATGALVATFDGGQTRTTQIAANARLASMAMTPDGEVDFGPVCAGQTVSQQFTILGNAAAPFQVTDIAKSVGPTFTLEPVALPANVAGNGANKVTFSVTAAPLDAGPTTSTLTITTDIPNGTPRKINLALDALPAGVSPSPSGLDFGSNALERTTLGQTVHVTNCSSGDLPWSNARIEGADAAEFAIVAAPTSSSIPATGFASWLVVLQAHRIGPKTATFSVDYPGGTVSAGLAGEGLGDTIGPTTGGEDHSYYTCSTSNAPAAWPLGIALLALRRRRRG